MTWVLTRHPELFEGSHGLKHSFHGLWHTDQCRNCWKRSASHRPWVKNTSFWRPKEGRIPRISAANHVQLGKTPINEYGNIVYLCIVIQKRVISGLLILLVLTGSFGMPVFKHTCHVFDKTEITVLSKKACCDPAERGEQTSVDWKCCTLQEFDTSVTFEATLEVPTTIAADWILPTQPVDLAALAYATDVAIPDSRPPPLANRELHNHYQVYRL